MQMISCTVRMSQELREQARAANLNLSEITRTAVKAALRKLETDEE